MRILHIIPDLQIGGAERLVINICNEINQRQQHMAALMVLSANNEYKQLTGQLPLHITSSTVSLSLFGKNRIHIESFNAFVENLKKISEFSVALW